MADEVLSRSFLVNTKTFNNANTATFGQFVPAVWNALLDFDCDGVTSIAHGIRNGGSSHFRTNVGRPIWGGVGHAERGCVRRCV
ncbi:MAG: hypothetical protein ABI718_02840 [Acidobacteriota bacterium]